MMGLVVLDFRGSITVITGFDVTDSKIFDFFQLKTINNNAFFTVFLFQKSEDRNWLIAQSKHGKGGNVEQNLMKIGYVYFC